MKQALLLALAASLAACHSRNDDQAAAAPQPGDTTAVTHQIDPERTGPPGTGGRPPDATVNADSVGIDSAAVDSSSMRSDSASTGQSPVSVPQDTLGPSSLDTTSTDTSRASP